MKRFIHISAKALKYIFMTIILLVVALIIILNSNFFDSIIKKQLQSRLSKAMNRKVTVEKLDFNPVFLDFDLKNFRISNDPRSPEVPFFFASEIYARVSWRYLISGRFVLSQVRVTRPELYMIFYEGGGNSWPKIKTGGGKKGGVSFIVSALNVNHMIVVFNNRRIPLDFSSHQLETTVRYDPIQANYVARTNFKDGRFRIRNFEFWDFALNSDYRIIGGHIHFDRLNFVSPQSKFYMQGEMYNLKDPFFDMHFRSQILLSHAKQMFRLKPEMIGAGTFRATYKGTFTHFRMQGEGDFRDFIFYSMPIDTATFDLDLTEDWLNVTNIQAGMFGGSYEGRFAVAPLKGRSVFTNAGDFKNLDGKRLGRFVRMQDMILPVRASGKAEMRWDEDSGFQGMDGTFRFKLEPNGSSPYDLAVAAEESNFDNRLFRSPYYLPIRNETEFRIEGRQLRNIQSHIQMPNTIMDVSGTIDLSGNADLTLSSHSEKIPEIDLLFHYLQAYFKKKSTAEQTFWRVRGSADFDGKMEGTVWEPFRPKITGNVTGKDILYHGIALNQVQGNVMFYGSRIEIYDSSMIKGEATGGAQATFTLGDKEKGTVDQIDLKGSVNKFPIAEIPHAFALTLPVSGKLNATIRLTGALDSPEGRSDFEAFQGELWGEKWDRATGTVLFFPDSLGLRNITTYINGGSAQVSGDLVYKSRSYNVEFSGENLPLQKLEILKNNEVPISGTALAKGSGQGTFAKPQLKMNVQVKNLTYKSEFYGEVNGMLSLQPDSLNLEASGTARGVTSKISANLVLDGALPFRADFDIQKFPLEILMRAYSPVTKEVSGVIGGKFILAGTLRPADLKQISGSLDLIRLNVAGIALEQARPLQVTLKNNVVEIQDSLLRSEFIEVSLTGKIYPKDRWKLDLNLSADIGLEILTQWDRNITANGTATIKVAVGGNLKQPTLTGAMEIKQGFFRHYSFPNSLTNISALVTFKNKSISLQSLTANSSGGTITAGGSATLKGYSLDTYRFDVYAQEIRVHYPEGLRSTVNAELHLQTQQLKSYLVGDIEVLQGVYTASFEESPTLFNYARVPTFATIGGAAAQNKETELNIRIHAAGNLLVRNNFANAESSADLTLTGTLDNPVLIGRMEVKKGTITFREREYRVVRGSLDFNNPYRTEPVLNFVAETKVREYTVTLTFSGTFERIYHDLSSDPPLPKDDIYALLGIGNTREAYQGVADVSALIAGQQISEFITSPITSPLEREFKKVFGLQRFQIDPVFVQTTQVATARITLQKDLSKDFSVTYSTNVFTAAEEFILLQYQVNDEVQITASKDERSRYGIDLLVTKTFE
jgi:hypothetical protein